MKEIRILKGKRKLYIQLFMAFLLFFIIASVFFIHFHRKLRIGELERCHAELQIYSEQNRKIVKAMLDNSLNDIRNMAEKIQLEQITIQQVEKELKKGNRNIMFSYIGMADTKGIAQTTVGIQTDIAKEEFFKKAIIGISNTSKLIQQPLKSQNEFVNAAPIYKDGLIVGVLYGAIDVNDFSKSMRSINKSEEYFFGIVEQNGNFVLNPKQDDSILSEENFWQDMLQTNLVENDIDNIKINMGQNENEIMGYILNVSGEQRYLHYMPYGKNKWYIVSVMNPDVMNRKLYRINVMVWQLMTEVLLAFAIIFAWIFYLSKKSRDEMIQMNQILKQNETSFAVAVSQGIQVVFDYDIETKQLTFRYKGNEKYGFPRQLENVPECLIHQDWIVPSSVEDVRRVFEKIEEGQQTASCIIKMRKPDGKYIWSKIIITNIFDQEKSKIIQTVGILEDATLLKENELQIAGEMELRKVITSNAIMSYEINLTRDTIIEQNSDGTKKINQEKQCYSKYLYETIQSTIYEEDRLSTLTSFSRENLFYVFFRGKRDLHLEYRRKTEGDNYIWVECVIHFLQEPESGDVKSLMVIKDINDKKGKELELKKQADMDYLTEVYNRATTEKLVTEAVSQKVEGNSVHAFLICDLDNFKTVNDTLGHQMGDKVLVTSAGILKKHFRKTDIVGRLGGDEFVVLMQNVNSFASIKNTVGRLVKEFDKTYGEGEKAVRTTISIGISLAPMQGSDFSTLYKKADKALYKVKENGRNGFVIFEEEEE